MKFNSNIECLWHFMVCCTIYVSTWQRRIGSHVYYTMTHVLYPGWLEYVRDNLHLVGYCTCWLNIELWPVLNLLHGLMTWSVTATKNVCVIWRSCCRINMPTWPGRIGSQIYYSVTHDLYPGWLEYVCDDLSLMGYSVACFNLQNKLMAWSVIATQNVHVSWRSYCKIYGSSW